jgi:Na+/H+-dicarboxylate symporter
VTFPTWLTPWSLVGLGLGIALGIAGNVTGWGPVLGLAGMLEPIGALWLGALRITVVPLVVIQMAAAVLGAPSGGRLGRLAGRSFGLFFLMLVGAALLAALVAPALVSLYNPADATVEGIRSSIGIDAPVPADAPTGVSWSLPVPSLVGMLTGRELLPLLLLAGIVAVGLRHLPESSRARVTGGVGATSIWLLKLVRLILLATPLGVFIIVLAMALEAGVGAAGVAVAFVVLASALLFAVALLIYPLTMALSRCSLRDFARALAPAQLVAVSTRSSIAALPALVEEGERELHLPPEGTGMVLPLAASVYKVSRPVETTFELIFLAHVFGVTLGPMDIAVFITTMLLLSVVSLGIPGGGGGGVRGLPVFLAAGVPIEGYFLIQAVDSIPDIFETLVNVTAYMSAAVILTFPEAPAPATEPLHDSTPHPTGGP